MARVTSRTRAVVIRPDGVRYRRETLAGEEPLEIRVNGTQLAVTMRTPGEDFALVAGNLVSEGMLRRPTDLVNMRYCSGDDPNTYNVIDANVLGVTKESIGTRRVVTTSACGVCGTTSIEEVRRQSPYDVADDDTRIPAEQLLALPDRLREAQALFDSTGGLHAAALFDASGKLLVAHEDVGRHNAVDKVIGWAYMQGMLPLRGCTLQVSGRASFELVQKSYLAGIPIMSAVSAPSSLAVDLAEEVGITLAGFSRGDRITVYTHARRVDTDALRTPATEPPSGATASDTETATFTQKTADRTETAGLSPANDAKLEAAATATTTGTAIAFDKGVHA
ncbi:formate dehydrogenase accessory sulfurtransferase FdhD [Gulosibacter bifidus]|uniref:Sulfur carrier protein FdhD n=1 Tax=Gulosibacter bifidus TaxID=272239 RepID=A0ABW5RJF9_9MICO|nr:formate dehydrogenase accessory sulfurtransferase FdhD [Gulosibacter bifidus]